MKEKSLFKDMNGREIYEGDILKDSDSPVRLVEWHNDKRGWEMAFEDGEREPFPLRLNTELEVIGNIYENPELFEFETYPEAVEMFRELLKATEGLTSDSGTYTVYNTPVSVISKEIAQTEGSEKRKYWYLQNPNK